MIDLLQIQHAIAHDPCRRSDRFPIGAVTVGQKVRIVLRAEKGVRPDIDCVFLEFANDPAPLDASLQRKATPAIVWRQVYMSECDEGYTAFIDTSGTTRVIFYRFRVCTPVSDILYIRRTDDLSTAGVPCLPSVWLEEMDPIDNFQLTVYEKGFTTPEWLEGSLMYQIFPDRFARGEEGIRWQGLKSHENRGWPVRVHEDWNEPPDWMEPYEPVDFYGGTLSGIREKLDYIESLGVDVLYLNPICESRSNHRYNTGDYAQVDEVLGTWQDFEELSEEAAKRGIRIVLDSVLSHTGSSSLYFNADGSYQSRGAFQDEDSPYRSWYIFLPDGDVPYRCWWNDPTLPEVEERDASWQRFMLGRHFEDAVNRPSIELAEQQQVYPEHGILAFWHDRGARGYRLDVADEIPDDVLESIRDSIKAKDPDAAIIGEVWEDATTKWSYGQRRTYALGRALDSVMNYPLRSQLIEFALGNRSAQQLATFLKLQRDNYPRPLYKCLMNLLSSHDVERIRSVLAAGYEFRGKSRSEQVEIVSGIDGEADWRAACMQRILAMVVYMLPGMPCLYYGDEKGMQGGRDPFCRATFPWDGQRSDCGADLTPYYQALGKFRRTSEALRKGGVLFCSHGSDILCVLRIHAPENGVYEGMLCVVNKSDSETRVAVDLALDSSGMTPHEAVAFRLKSCKYPRLIFATDPQCMSAEQDAILEDGIFIGTIGPMQACVYQISPGMNVPLERGGGIICHITSVPNPGPDGANEGLGTLGAPAKRFIDALSNAGIKYWQVLPVNPTDEHGSPYAGLSAFAGNMFLLEPGRFSQAEYDDFVYAGFLERNKSWIYEYATFMALKQLFGGAPWWEWPENYRTYSESLRDDPAIAKSVSDEIWKQFQFERQWREVRRYANAHGVNIIGDMPFYVSADSADVWAHRGYFSVDGNGTMLEQGGVPPDQFAEDGQMWGVPTYRWDALAENGYDWWVNRLARMASLFDYVRIDHFLGFSAYYAIKSGQSASEGEWVKGPGIDFFRAAYKELGPLPLLAEDLGIITSDVRQLLFQTGFAGMDVIQFADNDPLEWWQAENGKVAYTSTHDTQTLAGFAASRYCSEEDVDDEADECYTPDGETETSQDVQAIVRKLGDRVLDSQADVVMFTLQDAIGLGDEARMNIPGTVGQNWKWQATEEQLESCLPRMRRIATRRL